MRNEHNNKRAAATKNKDRPHTTVTGRLRIDYKIYVTGAWVTSVLYRTLYRDRGGDRTNKTCNSINMMTD